MNQPAIQEYFDIVDEENNLTGEVRLRSDAHALDLWHRNVPIYCFYKKDGHYYFLVHLRSKTKDLYPNSWDTHFGGHVKTGETVEQTAVSELKEEIGLGVNFADLIAGPIFKNDKGDDKRFDYLFFYNGSLDIRHLRFQDHEVQEVNWRSEDEILNAFQTEKHLWTKGLKDFGFVLSELKKIDIV